MLASQYHKVRRNILAIRQVVQIGGTLLSGMLYPIRRILSHDKRCQIDFPNTVSMTAPPDSPLLDLIKEIWVMDSYTRNNFRFGPDATIIDIGANIGAFAVWIARANPRARIIAVEPDPQNVAFLFRNLSRNKLANVAVVIAGCGGCNGEGILYERGSGAMHSLYSKDLQGTTFKPLCKTPIMTLEALFEQYGIQRCEFLKIDCEGAEYDILLNASHATLIKVSKIALEYHVGFNEGTPAALQEHLQAAGFEVEKLPMREDGTGFMYASQTHAPICK